MAHSAPARPRSRRASALRAVAGRRPRACGCHRRRRRDLPVDGDNHSKPDADGCGSDADRLAVTQRVAFAGRRCVAGRPRGRADRRPRRAAVTKPELWQQSLPAAVPLLSPSAASTGAAGLPTDDGLEATIGPLLADPILATDQVGVVVGDAATATAVFSRGGGTAFVPASTAKLATAVAALSVLGADHRLVTKVVAGPVAGQIVLVGGGDPTLGGAWSATAAPSFPAPATLADLASKAAAALHATGTSAVTLGYDTSLFSGPATAPGWKPLY